MSKIKNEKGYPLQSDVTFSELQTPFRWIANRLPFTRNSLTLRQRVGYALVSFLLGLTYLGLLQTVGLEFSVGAVLALLLGGMCFAVCIFNLIFIGLEKR